VGLPSSVGSLRADHRRVVPARRGEDLLARITRVTQRLLAMAAAIWHNWAAGAPAKRSLITYDN
jgi:hypothetical protein